MNIAEGIEGGYRHKTCSRVCVVMFHTISN